jgi:Uma2 family endonuclease
LTIPSLCLYVLVDQESPYVVIFRRSVQGFEREIYEGMEAKIPMNEIDLELPLAEIYRGVEFNPEPDDLEINRG